MSKEEKIARIIAVLEEFGIISPLDHPDTTMIYQPDLTPQS